MNFTVVYAQPRDKAHHLEVIKRAEKSLKAGPFSVTYKAGVAPSGDKHDYFSMRPYWWPNPKSKNGLPYINRDGELNPEANSNKFDRVAFSAMNTHTRALASGFHVSGRKAFATRCAQLIRVWFLDKKTCMNPNLNYAQWRPGQEMGSSTGIIRGNILLDVIETVEMIKDSQSWTKKDAAAWQHWLDRYAKWLVQSELGKEEGKRKNNHGTWYDVQVATFAINGGNEELAKRVIQGVRERIKEQISPSGQMPKETSRTKSWDYSVMNLEGFLRLVVLGNKLDIDIATYKNDKSGSIKDALDYLIPYASGSKRWPYKQIKAFKPERLIPSLKLAGSIYDDPKYLKILKTLENKFMHQ